MALSPTVRQPCVRLHMECSSYRLMRQLITGNPVLCFLPYSCECVCLFVLRSARVIPVTRYQYQAEPWLHKTRLLGHPIAVPCPHANDLLGMRTMRAGNGSGVVVQTKRGRPRNGAQLRSLVASTTDVSCALSFRHITAYEAQLTLVTW